MLEYLNFCLLCILLALILYLYAWVKKYFSQLKMAEELTSNLGYGAPGPGFALLCDVGP